MEKEDLCKKWLEILERKESDLIHSYFSSGLKEWIRWMKAYLRHNGILPDWMAWEPKNEKIHAVLKEIFRTIDNEIKAAQELRSLFEELGKEFATLEE